MVIGSEDVYVRARQIRMRLLAALQSRQPISALRTRGPAPCARDQFTATLTGHLSAPSGLGQSARSLSLALKRSGVAVRDIDLTPDLTPAHVQAIPWTPFNVMHVNADAMARTYHQLGREFYQDRVTIGYWYWELAQFRGDWAGAFRYVHEVWVASRFTQAALAPWARHVPVVRIPPPIAVHRHGPFSRDHFGLPSDPTMFLFMFDAASQTARKNPEAVIAAFRLAQLEARAHLVIKVMNGANAAGDTSWRRSLGQGISVIDTPLSPDELGALFRLADCYVSLHRAEGFGLTVAEAMAAGLPVIATDYGGVQDFLDETVGWPVGCREVPVERDAGPYLRGWRWAEPDVLAAAAAMREVTCNASLARSRGEQARTRMSREYSIEATAEACRRRLEVVRLAW